MIKAIFFDLDGVLTLEDKGSTGTCSSLCKHFPDLEIEHVLNCYKTHFGHLTTTNGQFADYLEDFSTCIGKTINIHAMHIALTDVTPNTTMLELAASLTQTYALGIITNNSSERLRLLEKTMNLPSMFDPIVVSGDVHCAKADGSTTIFELALTETSCRPEEAVFIDNAKRNLDTPSTMGMRTYWHDDRKNNVSALRAQLAELGVMVS